MSTGGETMTRRVTSKETIKRRTIEDMKTLGIHKPQYNRLITLYAGMVHQYLRSEIDFEESGYEYETETAAGNPKKSGIVSTMENLRKDILQYSDRLGLNPKGLESITAETKKTSTLIDALTKFDSDD